MKNEFIFGDSFKILPTLSQYQFQMILTDPLYNYDEETKQWLQNQFLRVCDGVIIVFSPWKNPWILPCDQKLYWAKPISTKNTSRRYSNFVEEIFVYGENVWNTHYHWSNYVNILVDRVDDISEHPWRKPPSMIERFIKLHTNEGDWVFDPFAGSGVVHDACIKLKRNSLSIEIQQAIT